MTLPNPTKDYPPALRQLYDDREAAIQALADSQTQNERVGRLAAYLLAERVYFSALLDYVFTLTHTEGA